MSEFNGHAEHYAIGQAMVAYGGTFMSNLGKALQNSDGENQRKIKETWSDDWNYYRELAIHMYKRGQNENN